MSVEEISKHAEAATAVDTYILEQLTPDIFNHKTRKHIKSLNINIATTIKGNGLSYSLLAPHYVHQLQITSSDPLKKKISVTYKVAGSQNLVDCHALESNGVYTYSIQNYVTEINISPEQGLLYLVGVSNKATLDKVSIFGLDPDALATAIESVKSLKSLKKNIEDLTAIATSKNSDQLDQITSARDALDKTHGDLDETISRKTIELASLQDELEIKNRAIKESTDEIGKKSGEDSTLARDIETKKTYISSLGTEISDLNKERSTLSASVRSLQENKSLFTDEIVSYAEQGKSNINMYLLILVAPSVILGVITATLLRNATSLTQTSGIDNIIQSLSYLIARVPYAIISITIIYACYETIKHVFDKIFFIHKDRLRLSSLSILAKDITDTARSELEITDEEIYTLRVKARMDLIKWHIQDGDSKSAIKPHASQGVMTNDTTDNP